MLGDICTCDCHRDGTRTIHFMDCCQYCYEKYITEDGEIDHDRYRNIEAQYQERQRWAQDRLRRQEVQREQRIEKAKRTKENRKSRKQKKVIRKET